MSWIHLGQTSTVSCFHNVWFLSRVTTAMTKQPILHDNTGGAGRLLGPQHAAFQMLPFKHPDSGKAEEIKPPTPAPAELFTGPKLDLTFLNLLNLIALVRGGADGGRVGFSG